MGRLILVNRSEISTGVVNASQLMPAIKSTSNKIDRKIIVLIFMSLLPLCDILTQMLIKDSSVQKGGPLVM